MSFNPYKLCFYYQVWHTNQLAAFEALKQLRSVYPTDEVILVIAGLKRENFDEYDKNFTQIIKQHFNITKTDYLYIDDHPYMSTTALRVPHTAVIRDEYMKFAHIWLDQFVSLPSDDVDIIINGSDDWVPLRPIPINFEIDVCGRICEVYDWMNGNELKKYIRYIADRRLISLGMKGIFKVKRNPLPWVETMINAPTHTNFFENRSTDYSKGTLSGTWNDVWGKAA